MNAGRCARTKRNGATHVVAELTHGPNGFIHRLLNTLPVHQQRLPGSRGFDTPPGTLYQPGLQKLLQLADLQADGRLGNAQQVRRRGKTAALDNQTERREIAQVERCHSKFLLYSA